MANIVISQSTFSGFGGPQVGATCKVCGNRFFTGLPVGIEGQAHVSLNDNFSVCPKCGGTAQVDDGFYEFFTKTVEILKDANLTRQQARRYALKISKTKTFDGLIEKSVEINPSLAEATRLALDQPDPQSALQTVRDIAKILAYLGGALLTTGQGVIIADDVWDRWNKDQLFEQQTPENSENIEDRLKQKPAEKAENDDSEKNPWGQSGSNDV